MSDPTVSAFLTKVLCKHGGRLPRDLLSEFLELPAEQIQQILQEEHQKFPQAGELVLARSPVRICAKYLKNEVEEECDKLHLCRHYLQGKCKRPRCTFSHDILSDQNRTVLKANEISGLNEDEIKVLLLQNDNQLLPEVCWKYLKDSCDLGKDCLRLHVCGFFTRGECNRRSCKFSHHVLEFGSDLLLTRHRMPEESIQNFQMICKVKHNERLQTLRAEGKKEQEKGQAGAQRGRPRNREKGNAQDGARSKSQGQQQGRAELYGYGISGSRPASRSGGSHLHGDNDSETEKSWIMEDWFNSKPTKSEDRGALLLEMAANYISVVQPEMSSGLHPPTSSMYTPYSVGYRTNVYSKLPATAPKVSSAQPGNPGGHTFSSSTPSAPQPKPTITPVTTVGSVNAPPTAVARPSNPVHLPVNGPSVADSVMPVPPTVVNPSTSLVPPIRSSSLTLPPTMVNPSTSFLPPIRSSSLTDSSTKLPSAPQDKPVNTPFANSYRPQPAVTTIKPAYSPAASPSSALSTPDSRLADSPTKSPSTFYPVNSSTEGPSIQVVKPVQPSVQPQDPLAPSSGHQAERTSVNGAVYLAPKRLDPDKILEICLSNLWKYCNLGVCCPDMHYYLPYRWQIYKGNDWEDISNMEEIEKCYCDPKVDRVQSVDFLNMRSGLQRVRRLSTVSSVRKPPEYVLTTEWLWYWKDEYGTWTQYGQSNVKQVSSTILSSDLENIYLSDPTAVIPFTAGSQHYEINFREMKQKNIRFITEKDVRRRPKYLSFEDVKLLKGSTKSAATKSPLKPAPSPLKTDLYPKTWDPEALPEIGCKKVPVSDTSSEFSEIVGSFTKTVSGHVVKKLWRLQNPSLWQVFQWQKEQMKKVNQGRGVKELQLFHGTDTTHIDAICNQNFDWRICGTHGTVYGQGSYFARDASYSHNYSTPEYSGTRSMFVARVLVGDYVTGNSNFKRPPQRPASTTRYYDSCVDNMTNPSIFVVFEKHQIYPEYLLEYEQQKRSCVIC